MSDEALVRACARGDWDAWAEFVRLYSGWALRVARATLRRVAGRAQESDVEDAVAEVFRQLLERDASMLRALQPPFHLKAWIAVITRRACLKFLRKKPLPTTAPAEESRAPDSGVKEAMALLAPEDRLMLELFFTHDAPYEEIAAVLGISVESVGKQKFRALQKLKAILEEQGLHE